MVACISVSVQISGFCSYILKAIVAEEVRKSRIISEEDVALRVDSDGTAKWKGNSDSETAGAPDQGRTVSKGPDGMFMSIDDNVSHSTALCSVGVSD
jgi:hypothetical protein